MINKIDESKPVIVENLYPFFDKNELYKSIDMIKDNIEEYEFYNVYLDSDDKNNYSFNDKSKYALMLFDEILTNSLLRLYSEGKLVADKNNLEDLVLLVDVTDRLDPDYKEDLSEKAIKKYFRIIEETNASNIEMCLYENDVLKQKHFTISSIRDLLEKRYAKNAAFKRENILMSIWFYDTILVGVPSAPLTKDIDIKLDDLINTILHLTIGLGNLRIKRSYKFDLLKDLFYGAINNPYVKIEHLEKILNAVDRVKPRKGLLSGILFGEKKHTNYINAKTYYDNMHARFELLKSKNK